MKDFFPFPYQIIRSRRKTICLEIRGAQCIVRAPVAANEEQVHAFLAAKSDWIQNHLEHQKHHALPLALRDGAAIPFLGQKRPLRVILGKDQTFTAAIAETEIILSVPSTDELDTKGRQTLERACIEGGIQELKESVTRLSLQTGLVPSKVVFKRLSSAWGICHTGGWISFNVNLYPYSKEAMDYVVLHELCHLKEMNHSPAFWNLVETFMPDYRRRKALFRGAGRPE